MKNESPFTAYPATNHKIYAREMCDAATFHAHFKITGGRKMWWSHRPFGTIFDFGNRFLIRFISEGYVGQPLR